MGWKTGSKKDPREDGYYSFSDVVKKLKKEQGVKCFTKKILGVYGLKQEAIKHEIDYHARLKVDVNSNF
jgi:hypothetical protein